MVLSNYGCELRLQCTVVGGVGTVWKGSALRDCQNNYNNNIVLLHSRFKNGTPEVQCDNGRIIGRGVKQSGNNFISKLIINLDVISTLSGNTIECTLDSGINETLIDSYTITHPLPRGMHIYTAIV